MTALEIEDIKLFTRLLFIEDIFDEFLVREADFVTYNTFNIDGHIKQGYYAEEELEENRIEEYSSWAVLKPLCFSIIKGKKLPISFHVILQLTPEATEKFVMRTETLISADQVNGLYINIRYEEEKLNCVTGTSVKIFTLDKTLDNEWDRAVKKFLDKNDIISTQLN